ncbi:MAG: histidinol-phosphate transaminase [Flavobacteriaceae bacterium]|nr:MAG: histidinol-phosphate transaminase [Flavobacteriaceae bacterium]
MDISSLFRENIKKIKPYSSAREEFEGIAEVYLDANENPFPSDFNRYPDPLQKELKQKLAQIKKVDPSQIFLSNGSDEAIDWLVRAFCEPKQDAIVHCPPTFGMYKVVAAINEVQLLEVPMSETFSLNVEEILKQKAKILFLCNPNNPTGTEFKKEDLLYIIQNFKGIVVIDEAYGDFANYSLVEEIKNHNNLVVLQTFSKAWGMAGLRLGMTFGNKEVISVLTTLKMPYNVGVYTQKTALEKLNSTQKQTEVEKILEQRIWLEQKLTQNQSVEYIYPSAANFLLVKFNDAKKIYDLLKDSSVLVRNQSYQLHCQNTLRITVGTPKENQRLIDALTQIQ